jgi:hypothetical protein
LKEVHNSLKGVYISLKEVHNSLKEVCISLKEVHNSLKEVCISLKEVYDSLMLTSVSLKLISILNCNPEFTLINMMLKQSAKWIKAINQVLVR